MTDISELSYGFVRGRFLAGILDTVDAGDAPDGVPLSGHVVFSSTAPALKVSSATPDPVTVFPTSLRVELDSQGYLAHNGERDIALWATDNPAGIPTSWQWRVSFFLKFENREISYPSFYFDLPGSTTVNLTNVAPITQPSPGVYITRGPKGDPGGDMTEAEFIGLVATFLASEPGVAAAAAAAVTDALSDAGVVTGQTDSTFYYDQTPESAAGGFVGENGAETDLIVNSDGTVPTKVIERWAGRMADPLVPALAARGVNPVSVIETLFEGGGFAGENDRATDLWMNSDGTLHQATLERWAPRLVPLLTAAGMAGSTVADALAQVYAGPDIALLGDSLTASGGIRTRLAALTGRTVRNLGVGGETTTSIMARAGVWPWLVTPVGGEIPASGSVDVTFVSSYDAALPTWPLLQGSGVREGDTYLWGTVAGVRVRLSIRVKDAAQNYPQHGPGDVYQITRATAGTVVPIVCPAPFLPEHGMGRREDIIIVWMGQNGPSGDVTFDGFQAIERWCTRAGARFLFMTAPGTVDTGWTALERRMIARWGRRYCNVRRFLIDDALALMGLTPTSADLDDIAAGRVPGQLRTDAVHHTAAAQDAMGEFLVYPRMKELEFI